MIKVTGLPAVLMDESIQAAIQGTSPVRISDLKVEKTYLKKMTPERIASLQGRIAQLTDIITKNQNEITAITSATDFLKKTTPFPSTLKATIAEVDSYAKFMERSLASSYERVARLERETKKLQEEKAALEKELNRVTSATEESKTLVFTLLSDREREVTLGFSYVVRQAGWSPQYEARVNTTRATLELACLPQLPRPPAKTGRKSPFRFLPPSPPRGHCLPPSPWYVDIYRPQPTIYKHKKSLATEELMREGKSLMMAEAVEVPVDEAKLTTEATSVSFTLPHRVTIPADNQPHRLLLTSASADAKLAYAAVPKLSPHAYLTAKAVNPFSFPLLPGQLHVFWISGL